MEEFIDISDIDEYEKINKKISKYKNQKQPELKTIQKSITYCKNCNIDNPDENSKSGIIVCLNCGECLLEIIDTTNITMGETNNFLMVNKYLPQLSTSITIKGLSKNSIIYKLHKWYLISYTERSLNEKYKLIQQICSKYNLSKCIEDTTKILYTQIYYEKLKSLEKTPVYRGNKYMGLIANCIWYSCMKYGMNLSPKELAQMCEIKITYVKKGEEIFNELCRLKNFEVKNFVSQPEDYIIRFCEKLNIHKIYCQKTLDIAKNIKKIKIFNGQLPITIALGVIYSACIIFNLDISKKVIAEMFDATPVSIIKTFRKFEPFLKILLNNEMCDIINNKITKYQTNIKNDLKYIYSCIKYNAICDLNNIKFNTIQEILNFQMNVNLILKIKIINVFSVILKNNMNLNNFILKNINE